MAPKASPPEGTPEGGPRGLERVKGHAEGAFGELERMTGRSPELITHIVDGTVSSAEASKMLVAQAAISKDEQMQTLGLPLERQMAQLRGDQEFQRAQLSQRVNMLQDRAAQDGAFEQQIDDAALLAVFSHEPIPIAEPRWIKERERIHQALPSRMLQASLPEQRMLTRKFLRDAKTTHMNEELAQRMLVSYLVVREKRVLARRTFQNQAIATAYVSAMDKTGNHQLAMQAAMQAAPEDLKKQYENFNKLMESENVLAVLSGKAFEAEAPRVEVSEQQRALFVDSVQGAGGELHVGGGGGEIHFGKLAFEVEFSLVDGKPLLSLFDRDADTGLRGPFYPSEMADARTQVMVDYEFSRAFRSEAGEESELDPGNIPDKTLMFIAQKLLEGNPIQTGAELTQPQKEVIADLAKMFAAPDTKYVFLEDKAAVLRMALADPKKSQKARALIQSPELRKHPLNIDEFMNRLA